MIAEATILGVVLALVFYERTGLTPGGLVVPAYLVLFVNQPERIVGTVAVSVTALLLYRVLARVFILYGRRRFATLVVLGVLLKAVWDMTIVGGVVGTVELKTIGFIVVGLIANDFERQGVATTLAMVATVTATTYLALILIRLWRFGI